MFLADHPDNCYYGFDLPSRELSRYRVPVVMEDCMLDLRSWERGRLKAELGGFLYVGMKKLYVKENVIKQQSPLTLSSLKTFSRLPFSSLCVFILCLYCLSWYLYLQVGVAFPLFFFWICCSWISCLCFSL
jgi:hypothetical protein